MMKLREVCHLIVDCPHSTAVDEGKGIPLIRTPNIGKGRFELNGVHRISESVYHKRTKRAVPQDNDIIFAREAPAGNAAIIKNGQKMCLGQRTVLIRPNPQKIDPSFLVYYLLAPHQQYKLLGTANGATVAHVNLPTIRDMKVDNLPDLPIQHRIADILSAYDDLIENNRKQIALLEEAAQRLYREWFVDFRFPGHETAEWENGLPQNVFRGVLEDIACFSRGKTVTKNTVTLGNIPVIAGGLEPAYFHNNSNTVAPVVTVSASGANAGFTSLHHRNVWASDCSFVDSQATNYPYWTYCFLRDNSKMLTNLQKGSAQPHVYAKDLNKLPAIIFSTETLNMFEQCVYVFFCKCAMLQEANIKLSEARDSLLPRLMSGELEEKPFIQEKPETGDMQ